MDTLRDSLRLLKKQDGFTIFETLIIVAILGISAAFSGPTFLGFLELYQLDSAQDQVHQAMRQAQSKAMQTSTAWRFGLRDHSGSVEWAIYQDDLTPTQWKLLSHSLKIDDETTLRRSSQGIYSTKFDHKGNAKILGRVTLTGKRYSSATRCVIVSTLLGTTRRGRGHSNPNSSGRFCY